MPEHERISYSVPRWRWSATVALVVASTTMGLSAMPAGASPQTDLASATAQAQRLEQQIAANSKRADILDEEYLQAQSAVAGAVRTIAATQKKIAATDAAAAWLRKQLAGRAARLYMNSGNMDPIGIDVSSVQDLGSMAKYGSAAAEQDLNILDALESTDAQLADQHHDLEGQLAAAEDQQQAAQDKRREVERVNASMQKMLDSANANVRDLAATIERQKAAAAAAAERARLQRLADAAAAARRAHRSDGSGGTGGGGGNTGGGSHSTPGTGGGGVDHSPNGGGVGSDPNLPPPSPGAAAAVAYARAQLGKPYVFAAAGPDSFDCSGLTMMAWAQSGVYMDHGSQSQYMSFPHVAIDQLQPGDLVFFGDTGPTNHHVGIVVGNGMMIDAPHTGANVELVSYYWSDLLPLGARP